MAENKAFSHITVNADDDDDVVIQAGIVDAGADAAADDGVGAPPGDPEPAEEPAGEEAAEVEETDEAAEVEEPGEVAPEPEPAPEPDPEPAAEPDPEPAAARPTPAADGYRETTLEDIESSKMSTVQKAVIVVALLGIVAFAVWFLLAR